MDARDLSQQPRPGLVALVVAMPSEARHLMVDLDDAQALEIGPWPCWSGAVDGRPAVLVATGIGMVNAAAALSALLSRMRPAAVLNVGCAGAHRLDILPGDVIVARETVAHGSVTVLPDGSERFLGHHFDVRGETVTSERLPADPSLLAEARAAARGWQPEAWLVAGDRLPAVHFGVVASADVWTQHPARLELLHMRHRSLCEDMEAAALAQVAAIYEVPFLAIKDVSNNEFLSATFHGPLGPTLEAVEGELARRAWALARRVMQRLWLAAPRRESLGPVGNPVGMSEQS